MLERSHYCLICGVSHGRRCYCSRNCRALGILARVIGWLR